MKLSGQRPELTGNLVSFYIVPLDPAYETGLAGHVPVNQLAHPYYRLTLFLE
jgi:hypothetical protein